MPSGLPRLPDDELDPPAAAKTVDDVAGYSDDPQHEREVLERLRLPARLGAVLGHRTPAPMTGVFVDQFERRAGAGAYAEDLARNDAEYYDGVLHEDPPGLPGRLPAAHRATTPARGQGSAARPRFAWCGHGRLQRLGDRRRRLRADAADEVRSAPSLDAQLDRLPPVSGSRAGVGAPGRAAPRRSAGSAR